MLRSVFLKSLRDIRRGFAWWSVGLAGLVALMVAVYPSVRDNPGLNKLVEDYPEALKAFIAFGGELDYTSGAGCDPLRHGLDAWHVLVLAGIAAAAMLVAVAAFDRRDLAV